ncbi:hypothetical protein CFIO01_04295 [Colletotrichum fioriniae PJ7]|uniref:C2H2-type domain-containing protein n=1 Tax=Colletotrichum fioriniae PJ7 TaxID=1445577 RepID=A0A010S7D6_9PEZI|nr:hypothetical protein CFIO01_04295 [Colletotrichum fioriniae PJ7]
MAPFLGDVAFEVIISLEDLIRVWRTYNGGPSAASQIQGLKSDLLRLKTWHADFTTRDVAEVDGGYLDHHLRIASHIQRQLLKLLNGIKESIDDAEKILTGQIVPWDKLDYKENTLEDVMMEPQTELQQIATEIRGLIDCLRRLRVATGDPAPHNRITSAKLRRDPEDYSFDVNFFKETWDKIEEFLADRLAHDRTSSTNSSLPLNEQLSGASSKHQIAAESTPPTIASLKINEFKRKISPDEDSTLSEGARDILQGIEAEVESVLHKSTSDEFQCPYCDMTLMLSHSDRDKWMHHVLSDLQPYVCVSRDCMIPTQQYSKETRWMQHMLANHLRTYQCPLGCNETYPDKIASAAHINQRHADMIPPSQLDTLISLSSSPMTERTNTPCPFCSKTMESISQYQSHVGRHQREAAMFALLSETLLKTKVDLQRRKKAEYKKRREEMTGIRLMYERRRAARDLERRRQREEREAESERCGERRYGETQKEYEERMRRRWKMLWQGRGSEYGPPGPCSILNANEGQEVSKRKGEKSGQVSSHLSSIWFPPFEIISSEEGNNQQSWWLKDNISLEERLNRAAPRTSKDERS